MQTFLPYPSFADSARCLDYRRLGKQRVEAKQLLLSLGVSVGPHAGKPQSSWRNHPAAKMWSGHEVALCEYGAIICREWKRRGYKDTLLQQFWDARNRILCDATFGMSDPNWLGWERFHAGHRSNLLRKDRVHYGQFGWSEPDDLPYVWPSECMEVVP